MLCWSLNELILRRICLALRSQGTTPPSSVARELSEVVDASDGRELRFNTRAYLDLAQFARKLACNFANVRRWGVNKDTPATRLLAHVGVGMVLCARVALPTANVPAASEEPPAGCSIRWIFALLEFIGNHDEIVVDIGKVSDLILVRFASLSFVENLPRRTTFAGFRGSIDESVVCSASLIWAVARSSWLSLHRGLSISIAVTQPLALAGELMETEMVC